MTTEYEDEYGDKYYGLEDFDLEARNDFTLQEFVDVVKSDDELLVDLDYAFKPGADRGGYGLNEKGQRVYLGKDYENPIGYRLHPVADGEFGYEGGKIKGFGTFDEVTSGNLGDGHEAWALFQHVESGRFFLNTGHYSSWDGGEMDTWQEVKPAEVKVVRYQDIKTGTIFDNPAVTVE